MLTYMLITPCKDVFLSFSKVFHILKTMKSIENSFIFYGEDNSIENDLTEEKEYELNNYRNPDIPHYRKPNVSCTSFCSGGTKQTLLEYSRNSNLNYDYIIIQDCTSQIYTTDLFSSYTLNKDIVFFENCICLSKRIYQNASINFSPKEIGLSENETFTLRAEQLGYSVCFNEALKMRAE